MVATTELRWLWRCWPKHNAEELYFTQIIVIVTRSWCSASKPESSLRVNNCTKQWTVKDWTMDFSGLFLYPHTSQCFLRRTIKSASLICGSRPRPTGWVGMVCAIYLIAENRNKVTLTVADLFVVIANRLLKPGRFSRLFRAETFRIARTVTFIEYAKNL